MKRFSLMLFLTGGLAVQALGQIVLNFDDLNLVNYAPLPAAYGNQLDPNLTMDFRTFDFASGTTLDPHIEFWNNDYGDLTKIAFPSINGETGEITFTPAPGYSIEIVSFDMAGWPRVDRTNTVMRFVDINNNLLLNFAAAGPVAIQGDGTGLQHTTFTPNFTHQGTIKFQWGTDWDIGIDNIQLRVMAIPEPSTWVLLSGALGALGLSAWRRRFRR